MNPKDGLDRTTGVLVPLTVNLTGASAGGKFYSNSSCTIPITQLQFAVGDSSKKFYYLALDAAIAPSALTFTASDASSALQSGSVSYEVRPAKAWIGTRGDDQNIWFESGISPASRRLDGLRSAWSVHLDAEKQYMYVADQTSHTIRKYNYKTGEYLGWLGYMNGVTSGGTAPSGSKVNPTINSLCATLSQWRD